VCATDRIRREGRQYGRQIVVVLECVIDSGYVRLGLMIYDRDIQYTVFYVEHYDIVML